MSKALFIGALAFGLTACGGGEAKELPKGGTAGGGGGGGSAAATVGRSLPSGTRVSATIQDALSSRTNKSGETVHAVVSADVTDARGNVVIPAGSAATFTIDKIEPGSDQVRPEGRLMIDVASVTVRGQSYPLTATLDPIAHHLEGRGITKDEAARVAAGTAIGAGIGQVIGKNTKGTVIGGAVGAVAGGAVAVRYAYRDVIVSAGTPVVFTLGQALNISAR
jgi:hypothetical protein